MPRTAYRGRFAPSPTGPLHAGSLVAALASWLDARAHHGTWLVRLEDIDPPRCPPGADQTILQQLAQCSLLPDEAPTWQSQRHSHYAQALAQLQQAGLAYACGCTRKDIEAAWQRLGLSHQRHVERPYPGTCRQGLHGKPVRSWRFALDAYVSNWPAAQAGQALSAPFSMVNGCLHWHDRRLGPQQQHHGQVAGDFVLQRADGLYAYQLAVVVDDALQGITHIVRGEDLADNTPRQLLLQHALGLPHPQYLHTPLVRMPDGEKLSKQHGAQAVELHQPLQALNAAAQVLQLPAANPETTVADALAQWVEIWRSTYNAQRD
ncbi:tRNA glutamyl-Q(34) synthetase GluQRS [Comamonas aquatica]|uniref:tRNA glutamyl-Q(34) synthetase GluQRS n=1 Tax=Comamonas aquatica TaxID=225991 RepID=UPI0024485BBC|nr:tRNA glutamyl-Q(34) synthetase GluQRS [Comamonas aquatica]MDH1815488.1 tRNA glutamyl-Q(34) synthetase GluQRS [Comamonas aquatica]